MNNNIQDENIYIGIDLGTTNTVVYVIDQRVSHREMVLPFTQLGEQGHEIIRKHYLPSVVYFGDNKNAIVGAYAKAMAVKAPNKAAVSVKSRMGRRYFMEVEGTVMTPELISAHILKAVKRQLEDYLNIPQISRAVITVPASFDSDQREATINAARLAGFEMADGYLLDEPTSAASEILVVFLLTKAPEKRILWKYEEFSRRGCYRWEKRKTKTACRAGIFNFWRY